MELKLLRIGAVDEALLRGVIQELPRAFGLPCTLHQTILDPAPAFHVERQQYHSSELLRQMLALPKNGSLRLLGVTDVDLYIPILTFVFGEAQIGGPCAVVSTRRLRQEFYGLPPDDLLLRRRLIKEAVHELGHTFDLVHCDDYSCAMAASHNVELIDLKQHLLCGFCRDLVRGNGCLQL